jgi:hypothetical protein
MKAKTEQLEPAFLDLHDKLIDEFLASQRKTTRKTYASMIRKVVEFSGESGAEMLRNRRAWEKKVFALCEHLREIGYSPYYINSCVACLRGFFAFNRKPLFFTSGERKRLKPRGRVTEDFLFDSDMLYKMYLCGTLKARYVIAVGKSIGLRSEDFAKLTFGQFRSIDLNAEAPIFLGAIDTEKEGVKAFCFLDKDAIEAVKYMLQAHKGAPDSGRVWTGRSSDMSGVLQRCAEKANIDSRGKVIRFHALRKFLFDSLNRSMSIEKAKMIIGKMITESAYLSPASLREDYAQAMHYFAFNGNGTKQKLSGLEEQLKEKDARIAQLEAQLAEKDTVLKILAKRQTEPVRMGVSWTEEDEKRRQRHLKEDEILRKFISGK